MNRFLSEDSPGPRKDAVSAITFDIFHRIFISFAIVVPKISGINLRHGPTLTSSDWPMHLLQL
jgi:hypothetical protein